MRLFSSITPVSNIKKGITWIDDFIECSLYVEDATKVEYFFLDSSLKIKDGNTFSFCETVSLNTNYCFGNIWSWRATFSNKNSTSNPFLYYIIRISRKHPQNNYAESYWILDPYTKESIGGEEWGKITYFELNTKQVTIKQTKKRIPLKANQFIRMSLIRPQKKHTIRPQKPNIPWEKTILYECHVRGMTNSPTFKTPQKKNRGTFQGLKECIPYFKKLGVTSIELLPIFDFNENENPNFSPETKQPLYNYWGYSPLLFFGIKQSYASELKHSIQELKNVVDAFHKAGLEIILDVVFNHTAELDKNGPAYHFKRLSEKNYYLQNSSNELSNYSGCGNTIQSAHPIVKEMIIDSLNYWIHEIGVDGFRFDLSSILTRNQYGILEDSSPFLWEIKNYPSFKDVKWIAEPWDAGGGYQLGKLAKHASWPEWNDQFRDTIKKILRSDNGMSQALKMAVLGSPNIYQEKTKDNMSINFITSHDGMTLFDLVSYNQKNNFINGENDNDGHHDNISFNCGVEGETTEKHILELREQKLRCFHILLQVSKGVPMILAGDEFKRTQNGNNNTYCHDSPLNWINWKLLEKNQTLWSFVQKAIEFRKTNFDFLFGKNSDYTWYNSNGKDEDHRNFVKTIQWKVDNTDFPNEEFFFLLNWHQEVVEFKLPTTSPKTCILNSAQKNEIEKETNIQQFLVQPFSLQIIKTTKSQ